MNPYTNISVHSTLAEIVAVLQPRPQVFKSQFKDGKFCVFIEGVVPFADGEKPLRISLEESVKTVTPEEVLVCAINLYIMGAVLVKDQKEEDILRALRDGRQDESDPVISLQDKP